MTDKFEILDREKQWLNSHHFMWNNELYGQIKGPPMRSELFIIFKYQQGQLPCWIETGSRSSTGTESPPPTR
jgi:hypothetical protein